MHILKAILLLVLYIPTPGSTQLFVGSSGATACGPTSCTPTCGSFCTYYTCVGPSTGVNLKVVDGSNPAFKSASNNCQGITKNEYLNKIPKVINGTSVKKVPVTISLSSYACQSHRKYGPKLWSTGSYGGCSATCSGTYGVRTRSVTCSSPPCCAVKPGSTISCSGSDGPSCPPASSICAGDTYSASASNGCGYCNISGTKTCSGPVSP